MRVASAELRSLLVTGRFVRADLWTITLAGGTVIRWTGADKPIVANGNIYAMGPAIEPSQLAEKIGVEVATLTLTIFANADDTVGGVPLIPFVVARGLDGATLRHERAYAPDWASPITGTVTRFAGRITSINDIRGSSVVVTVSSWMILLNVNMPPHLYQSSCLHQVYDAGCALNPASFSASATVSAGVYNVDPTVSTVPTQIAFICSVRGVTGLYDGGKLRFTSGANSGVVRKIQTLAADGTVTLANPLPSLPGGGDAFTATQGCDRTSSTCSGRFNNLVHFKGTEFVPVPETAL